MIHPAGFSLSPIWFEFSHASLAAHHNFNDTKGHKLVVGADSGDIRACFSHSGSVIRQLDPHNGSVNWLSFASRKTDK